MSFSLSHQKLPSNGKLPDNQMLPMWILSKTQVERKGWYVLGVCSWSSPTRPPGVQAAPEEGAAQLSSAPLDERKILLGRALRNEPRPAPKVWPTLEKTLCSVRGGSAASCLRSSEQ